MDPELWTVGRFQDFLSERRTLLASGINTVLRILGVDETMSEDIEERHSTVG